MSKKRNKSKKRNSCSKDYERNYYKDEFLSYAKIKSVGGGIAYTVSSMNEIFVRNFFSSDKTYSEKLCDYKLTMFDNVCIALKNKEYLNNKDKEMLFEAMGYELVAWCYKNQEKFHFSIPFNSLSSTGYYVAKTKIPNQNGELMPITIIKDYDKNSTCFSIAVIMEKDFTNDDIREYIKISEHYIEKM